MINRVTHRVEGPAPERIRVAVPAPLRFPLDYLAPSPVPEAGARVTVPLGKRKLVGVVLGRATDPLPASKTYKQVEQCLDAESPTLPADTIRLCLWAADYYQHPVGEVFAAALPALLRRTRPVVARKRTKPRQAEPPPDTPPQLTSEQASVLAALESQTSGFGASLIEGVTGSGKTELYLRCVQRVLEAGHQSLVLVPEIGLTPQLLSRFRARFGMAVGALHSGLTDRKRMETWTAARDGKCRVLIGTRSAIFTPLPDLGLIIVDEEHDSSYKQQEGFRYHARDLAVVRAKQGHLPVILGSATPSLESLANARSGRYTHLKLSQRVHARPMPPVRPVDLRGASLEQGLSPTLIDACSRHLDAGGQVLVYLNRRGFAPALLCHDCGWTAPCPHCDARMVLHRSRNQLLCHHCGSSARIPASCGQCSGATLIPVGQGTERIEQALNEHFPDARIEAMDSDRSRRAGELEQLLDDFRARKIQMLVGTQMLTKGHDFEGLSLVCVVDADDALYSTDFRALERLGQSLTQVAGRAGRGLMEGEVLLQTHQPQHPSLNAWLKDGYAGLVTPLLDERRLAGLPPYASLALLRADSLDPNRAMTFLGHVAEEARHLGGADVMGPIPAPMERRANRYRAQLMLRCPQRPRLQKLLRQLVPWIAAAQESKRLRWSVDVDPVDLY